MADKTVIIKLDVQEAGAISSIEGLNNSLKKLDKTSDEYAVILKKIQAEETKLASIQNKRAAAQKSVTKALDKQSDATGSATAATMELSRVVSDAPYGIRGMANNITQLVSQLGSASTKAGGLGAALKLMGKQLMGPLGIVFLITAAVSALDYFKGTATKATKAIGELTKETYASGLIAKQYVKELEDVNITEERREVVIQELIKSVPTLKKEDLEYGKNLDKVREKINQYTLAQAGRIEMEKLVEKNSSLLSRQMKVDLVNSTENQEEKLKIIKALLKEEGIELETAVNQSYAIGQSNLSLRKKTNSELIKDFEILSAGIKKESDPILEQVGLLTKALNLDPKKNNKPISKAEEGTVKFLENQKSALLKTQKEVSKTSQEWESYAAKIKKVQEEIDKITEGNTRKKVDVLGLDSIDIGENKKKMKKVLDAVADAVGVDLKKDPLKIDTNVDLELSDEAKKIIADKLKRDLDNLMLDSKLEDAKNFIDKSKAVLGAMTDFVDSEFERELTIEQNKTNALNTELNNRLNNENLSKEQRASIQNQIAQNDEKLRVKQDAIEKKKFKMNKAARIANALMDTASAAIGVMADSKGGFFARLANAIPTIAFGLAQVAAISRQKFKSSASKTPISTTSGGGGSSGGGTGRAEASFNIVGGRTKEDALLGAIQAKFDQPIKAYVVSGDVTNQQQLDRVIVSSSSL